MLSPSPVVLRHQRLCVSPRPGRPATKRPQGARGRLVHGRTRSLLTSACSPAGGAASGPPAPGRPPPPAGAARHGLRAAVEGPPSVTWTPLTHCMQGGKWLAARPRVQGCCRGAIGWAPCPSNAPAAGPAPTCWCGQLHPLSRRLPHLHNGARRKCLAAPGAPCRNQSAHRPQLCCGAALHSCSLQQHGGDRHGQPLPGSRRAYQSARTWERGRP